MIQNRIEGFVALHSLVLFALLEGAFQVVLLFFRLTNVVTLSNEVSFGLYSLGILVAAVSIHRHLHANANRYGRLTVRETVHLTAQQMMRLMLIIFAIAVVTKDMVVSRAFLLTFIGTSAGVLLLANLFAPRCLAFVFVRQSKQRTMIIATGKEALKLGSWLQKYAELGVEIVGYVSPLPAEDNEPLPWLGSPDQLDDIVRHELIDQVLIDQSYSNPGWARQVIDQCERLGCRVRSFIDIATLLPSPHATFEHDGDYAFASVTPEPLDNPLNRVAKRTLDIAIALPVVVLLLPPVLLITAFFQSFQAPGPLLHFQWRSGINRRRFLIYKIRSMYVVNSSTAVQATRSDSRIYPFGRFLRRTSLDELPQFLNVLGGEMSVSGPRPHLIEHDEIFARSIKAYRKRHFVKPGITGLAQSKGCRGETARPTAILRRVRYDMLYIAKWSFLMDVRIIVNTVRQIIFPPPSAY